MITSYNALLSLSVLLWFLCYHHGDDADKMLSSKITYFTGTQSMKLYLVFHSIKINEVIFCFSAVQN